MRRLLLFAILALSISAGAQPDYQCVLPGRAHFFSNAKGYLRGMRIDSIRAIGGATVLYPFHTRRIRDRYKIDSNGGSWLGKEIRQFPNGRTEFQNYWSDTVVIETVAKVGESWTFCRDTTSLSVTALVASIDTATIDGTLDSIKAIRLTALNNGIPDPSNPISNYQILLSKDHGFREIFDLYTFPYAKPGGRINSLVNLDYFLQVNSYSNPAAYVFRPVAYHTPLISDVYDFQPGDMFKRTHSRQEVGYDVYTVYDVIQDSVISKTKVPGGVQYMCSSRAYQRTVYDFQNRPATESWSGTGEIVRFYPDKAIFLIDTANMPEEGTLQNVYYYYPNDSSRCYKSPSYKRKSYSFPQALDTQPDEYAIYKVGFGLTDSAGGFRYGVNDYQRYYSQSVSAKKSGLVCGDFVPLSAGISVPGSICSVFPNPATDQLSVELPLSARYAVINISDITGRHVLNQSLHYGSNQISIRDFSNGTYLLQIISGNARRTERLVIAH